MAANNKIHVYKVEMTCEGCVNSVSNVLKRNKDKGIESFDVHLPTKTVKVTSPLDFGAVLEIIKKTGKEASYVGEESH